VVTYSIKDGNQQKIVSLGRLLGVIVDIERFHTTTIFELIEIVDDINPYHASLGIDLDFDNLSIINLNKRQMICEGNNMRVIVPWIHQKEKDIQNHLKKNTMQMT